MGQHIISDLIPERGVKIVTPNLPLHAARVLLAAPQVEALLVLSDTGPCGVVRHATFETCGPSDVETPVAGCMTLVGPAIPDRLDAAQALRVMRSCGCNDLPVMNAAGEVVSLISVADLMMVPDVDLCEDLVA